MLPIMLIFIQSTGFPGIFYEYAVNICLEKEIQLLLGESYMFGDVIIWYVQ